MGWGRTAWPRGPGCPCRAFASRGSGVVCPAPLGTSPGAHLGETGNAGLGFPGGWGSCVLCALSNPKVPVSLGPPGPHTTDWVGGETCLCGFGGRGWNASGTQLQGRFSGRLGVGRNDTGRVTPTPQSFEGGATDSQASRCGCLVLWSPETPCASALGRAVQAAVMGQRSLPAAGFLRGPGPCSWL